MTTEQTLLPRIHRILFRSQIPRPHCLKRTLMVAPIRIFLTVGILRTQDSIIPITHILPYQTTQYPGKVPSKVPQVSRHSLVSQRTRSPTLTVIHISLGSPLDSQKDRTTHRWRPTHIITVERI